MQDPPEDNFANVAADYDEMFPRDLAEDSRMLEPFFEAHDVRGLFPLGSHDDVELDALALPQALEAFAQDGREMHEHLLAGVLADEAEALGLAERLHLAPDALRAPPAA